MRRLSFFAGLTIGIAFFTSAPAQAADFGQNSQYWTGWYAGVRLGINHNAYDGFGSRNAFAIGFTVGYNYQLNSDLVIGGDLYSIWNSDTGHKVNSLPGVNANFGSRTLGADFIAGFPVGDFLPYLKLGYGRVQISGDLNGSANGTRYSAGIMWHVNPYSALTLQYTYQKVTIGNIQGNGDFRNSDIAIGYNWFFD